MVIDGIYYALGLGAGAAVIAWLTSPLWAIPLILLAAFCLYFFRDPEREIPPGPVAVSPADGKVVAIQQESSTATRISIFLNIFDVHVNRAPISGQIVDIQYQRGEFLVASKERASSVNEQNIVTLQGEGTRVVFKQIAGLIARRIVFDKKLNQPVVAGERIGMIKFGSRVDVILGPEWMITAIPGQRVQAGASILAVRQEE
ncbi:MAG: phosphatidylserine decarboxylase [Bryobacteraceae bacterium]